MKGAIHKRRRQFFRIFDNPLLHVGSFLVLSVVNFDQFWPLPPSNCRCRLWMVPMLIWKANNLFYKQRHVSRMDRWPISRWQKRSPIIVRWMFSLVITAIRYDITSCNMSLSTKGNQIVVVISLWDLYLPQWGQKDSQVAFYRISYFNSQFF